MAITLAGVTLPTPNASTATWVEGNISPSDVMPWGTFDWPGPNRVRWPYPPRKNLRPILVNRLHWPRDAMRFAYWHGIVCDDDLDRIRRAAYIPSQSGYLPLPLTLSDDYGGTVTASMFMLPPRPLAQVPGRAAVERDLYLLTLVDDRFFWSERAADIVVNPGTTTWTALFAAIASGLGITLDVDVIQAAYLKPPAELTAHYESLPMLLDACCQCVGQRFCRTLDGRCLTQNARTALASQNAQLTAWQKQAGGVFSFDPRG